MTIGTEGHARLTGVTRYHQVAAVMRSRISEGHYGPGQALPSEQALAQEFGYSTETVRRALDQVQKEGWIDRIQGRGTFVRPRALPLENTLGTIPLDLLLDSGSRFPAEVVSMSRVVAPPRTAVALAVAPTATVLQLNRLRRADERAVSYSRCYFADPLAPNVARVVSDGAQSLLSMTERSGDLRVDRVEEVLEATSADRELCAHLGVSMGSPIMSIFRTYHSGGLPVSCGMYYWLADSVRVVVEFRRSPGPTAQWVRAEPGVRAPRRNGRT
jgi:GntR family transcriptional regulator